MGEGKMVQRTLTDLSNPKRSLTSNNVYRHKRLKVVICLFKMTFPPDDLHIEDH